MLAGSGTAAATTSGPAQAPRPASGALRGGRTALGVEASDAHGATARDAASVTYGPTAGDPQPGPALQPGHGDGPGETEGQRQGGAGGLEPGRQESAGVLSGRRGRGGRGGAQPWLLEGGGNRQDPPPADRPDDDEGPADHGVLRDCSAARLAEMVP